MTTALANLLNTCNPTAKRLLEIIEKKQSNLAFNPDVTKQKELLHLANLMGPHICVLKTHIDLLEDFTPSFIDDLKALSEKHNFLIFEDRKFADIHAIVKMQYVGGIYKIASFADIVNAHILPGEGVITGLKEGGFKLGRACLLVAQMSPTFAFSHPLYLQRAEELARKHKDFVIGFIAKNKITDNSCFFHFTPGVRIEEGTDAKDQRYTTPEKAIGNGADVVIVGRGILQANDPVEEAKIYQERAFAALKSRLL